MRPSSVLALVVASATLVSCQDFSGDLGVYTDLFQTVCTVPTPEDGVCFARPATCNTVDTPQGESGLVSFPTRYFYNETTGSCQSYPAKSICPPLSANYFETLGECTVGCMKQCQQGAPSTDGNCAPLSEGFYYNGQECLRTGWDGCRTTDNIFESAEECSTVCDPYGGAQFANDGGVVQVRASRQAAAPSLENNFCQDFKESNPEAVGNPGNTGDIIQIVSAAPVEPTTPSPVITEQGTPAANESETEEPLLPDLALPTDIGDAIPVETPETLEPQQTPTASPPARAPPSTQCQRLGCIRSSVSSRSHLNWVSVYARENCMEVVMRLNCRKGLFRRPNDTELNRLCGLVKRGVEKYWSRSITHECNGQSVTTNVRVRVQLVDRFLSLNAKDVVIKVYDSQPAVGNTRSHNSDILSMTMKYNYENHARNPRATNDIFAETGAHEVGHSVLRAAMGFSHSWTHKGTSTWFGKLLNEDRQPASGEIDLMKYYAGARRPDWRDRTIATETDVLHLVDVAKFAYCSGGDCGDAVGHPVGQPCIENRDCASGHCQFLRCVECKKDSHCNDSQQCAHRLKLWKPNRCEALLSIGAGCVRDRQCASGHCHGLRCGECTRDSDCEAGNYCYGRNLPIVVVNRCKPGKGHGAVCARDAECANERCHGLRCGECETDSHCPSGQFCSGRNLPLVQANRCRAGKAHGAVCSRDAECESERCHGLRCGECERDSHCPSGEYCSGRNVPLFQANRCKAGKDHGAACTRDAECGNERCHGLRCGECERDSHCPSGQYCSGRNLPLVQANRCKAGKNHGAVCTRDAECVNERCHGLRCGECERDSHCPSGQHCSGRNLPLVQANRCKAGKAHGTVCSRDAECESERCHGLRCGECERDSHCPSGQYCSGRNLPLVQANRCKAGKNHGAVCTRDAECANERCHGLRCGECENDGHCRRNQFCSGRNLPLIKANRCKGKLSIASLCSRDSQCASGHCDGGRCGYCNVDSDCPGNEYCYANNLPLVVNLCRTRKNHGSACTKDSQCKSGKCHGLRCGECERDGDCRPGQFCSGRNVPLLQANRCKSRLSHGAVCSRDRQCTTSHCHGLRCSDCSNDGDCPRGQFCYGKNLPLVTANRCKAGKSRGSACLRSRECASSHCTLARCSDCSNDSHCPSSHHCAGSPPFTIKECKKKKCSGFCTSSRQCGGKCRWLRCRC